MTRHCPIHDPNLKPQIDCRFCNPAGRADKDTLLGRQKVMYPTRMEDLRLCPKRIVAQKPPPAPPTLWDQLSRKFKARPKVVRERAPERQLPLALEAPAKPQKKGWSKRGWERASGSKIAAIVLIALLLCGLLLVSSGSAQQEDCFRLTSQPLGGVVRSSFGGRPWRADVQRNAGEGDGDGNGCAARGQVGLVRLSVPIPRKTSAPPLPRHHA